MKKDVGGRAKGARTTAAKRPRIAGNVEAKAFGLWLWHGVYASVKLLVGFAIGLSALGLAAFGMFRNLRGVHTSELLALCGLGALLLVRLFDRVQHHETQTRSGRIAEYELGTLFIATAFVIIEVTGGPSGLLYPLIYALVAFLMAFHSLGASLYFLALILVGEAGVNVLQPSPDGWRLFASHASFNLLFGLLYALFLRAEIVSHKRSMQKERERYFSSIDAEAKEFRLTSGLSLTSRELTGDEMTSRRKLGSVQAIHESLYNVLAVAERALSPHTVALFWMDADDKFLRLKELRSHSDWLNDKPIAAGEGFLGAITKRREPLLLTKLKAGQSGLVYYTRPHGVTDFAGVPVVEGKFLRGVLVADRTDGKEFQQADVDVLNTLAAEITRAVQVERIFSEMDREKFQKERFYEASREFNKALTVDQVAQKALAAAKRVAQVEFAAVCVATEREGRLRIAAAEWAGHSEVMSWVGKEFGAEEGLVGASLKARHPLPHGTSRVMAQAVFGGGVELSLAGTKVVPLLWQETGVGAVVLASAREDFLPLDTLDMLKVIADHAAIAMANAQMFERMEKMATTDGLTGLTNHRHFQAMFDTTLARAERYGRKLSVILTDIDHFKSVNDTYGHPTGDKVLKRVAQVLAAQGRRTDIVARYGGEEFAILMEETDKVGAKHIAERIRKAVEAETFHSENGSFKSTLSLGIATFPDDASTKAKLLECTDQSLYAAKRSGRNRVMTWDMVKGRREVTEQA